MSGLRNLHLLLIDLILIPATVILAFVIRLDTVRMRAYMPAILVFVAVAVPVKIGAFWWLGLYRRYWRYASMDELLLVAWAAGVSSVVAAGLLFAAALPLSGIKEFPRSVILIDGLLTLLAIGAPRFGMRFVQQRQLRSRRRKDSGPQQRVLVVGAGDAGAMIVQEMRSNPQLGLVPVGFLDDNAYKHGVNIHGVPVLGGREQLAQVVRSEAVEQIIIAMPTAPGSVLRDVLGRCKQAGVPARTVPGLYDILSGHVSVSQLREVDIDDLLRREPVHIDVSGVAAMLRGQHVLVTGAGGSIGAELCRQIGRCHPASLIMMGHGENSIFDIQSELTAGAGEGQPYHGMHCHAVVADVRDLDRLRQVFALHHPGIVFHAAAHKHVPLMEDNAPDAITNNIEGTAHLLRLCEEYEVERFVLISTDKAVNPSSVMGATKRLAELLAQEAARGTRRHYVSVRFGNVLGSRGSVVPLFRRQIARGGPVTVTHPEVRRYFMTIPEAVQLVLQASALGDGGEVFVLNMGQPIRVADLARDLIELSGLQVGKDIDITYIGLRKGEKLSEELFVAGEEYLPTPHEHIFILRDASVSTHPPGSMLAACEALVALARHGDEAQLRAKLQELVPEYSPA
jgi:FlaA1/EpsC-like NDP-sugar epimerase